eukprot:12766063-Alexandrium_andersonii.AAC.1
MSASLVGSEMCIRDSRGGISVVSENADDGGAVVLTDAQRGEEKNRAHAYHGSGVPLGQRAWGGHPL